MLIGYARVSTIEQETHLQMDALKRANVKQIFSEKASGVSSRPELQKLLQTLKPGDILVVYKLDRLARSLRDLLGIIERLEIQKCGFKSLTEPIDTSSPAGMLMLQMLGAVAQFERSLIRERTIAGQIAAITRGARLGRPRKLTSDQDEEIFLRYSAGETKASLSRRYNAGDTTIELSLARFGISNRKKRVLRPVLGPILAAAKQPVN